MKVFLLSGSGMIPFILFTGIVFLEEAVNASRSFSGISGYRAIQLFAHNGLPLAVPVSEFNLDNICHKAV